MNWKRGKHFCFGLVTIQKRRHNFFQVFDTQVHSILHSYRHFLTYIWQQFQRILSPLNPSKHFLWMEPFYSKMFFDNNTINYKNITSTLGEFWTHFIGKKALKVHFFKKMVNLTHSYLISIIFKKTGFFIFQD